MEFQFTLFVILKKLTILIHQWQINNVKSVWYCIMCRHGGHAEIYQAQQLGGDNPARLQEAGESSGHQRPWPAGLYQALPRVSALPGHSWAHQLCFISSCGKIVYYKAGDVATNAQLTRGMVNQSFPRPLCSRAFFGIILSVCIFS